MRFREASLRLICSINSSLSRCNMNNVRRSQEGKSAIAVEKEYAVVMGKPQGREELDRRRQRCKEHLEMRRR